MTKKTNYQQLEEVLLEVKELEDQLGAKKLREESLRDLVHDEMSADGQKSRTSPNNKFTYSIKSSSTLELEDESVVRDYLQSQGRLSEFMKLDITKAKRNAKLEGMPGFTEKSSTSFAVTPIKEKEAKVEAEETDAEFRKRVRGEA